MLDIKNTNYIDFNIWYKPAKISFEYGNLLFQNATHPFCQQHLSHLQLARESSLLFQLTAGHQPRLDKKTSPKSYTKNLSK